MGTIYFGKIKEDARIPTKRLEDGCFDIYACFDEDEFIIPPYQVKLVPTGLISAFHSNRRIAFRERGTNTKSGLIIMAGQIDSGYRGEYFVALFNPQPFYVVISKLTKEFHMKTDLKWGFEYKVIPYEKAIGQFALEWVPDDEIVERDSDFIKNIPSERGDGSLGSSGK